MENSQLNLETERIRLLKPTVAVIADAPVAHSAPSLSLLGRLSSCIAGFALAPVFTRLPLSCAIITEILEIDDWVEAVAEIGGCCSCSDDVETMMYAVAAVEAQALFRAVGCR